MSATTVQLFPLQTVLFPGGPLPLRIFEARYLDMISRCMRENLPFGVVLLREGSEAGAQAAGRLEALGTLARIVDWYQGTDGLLGITAVGTQRFRIHSVGVEPDGLRMGSVELLQPEPSVPVPEAFAGWKLLLRAVLDDLGKLYATVDKQYDDASWLGYRFAEVLPLDNATRQHCLEMTDALQRLEYLRPLLQQVREGRQQ